MRSLSKVIVQDPAAPGNNGPTGAPVVLLAVRANMVAPGVVIQRQASVLGMHNKFKHAACRVRLMDRGVHGVHVRPAAARDTKLGPAYVRMGLCAKGAQLNNNNVKGRLVFNGAIGADGVAARILAAREHAFEPGK